MKTIQKLQHYCGRWWYSPLMAALACADIFIVIIPTDGILISSSILKPKKWFNFAFATTLGSTIGGLLLAYLLEDYEHLILNQLFPGIEQSQTWGQGLVFFERWGLLLLFASAASPLPQQPAVLIATLAENSLMDIFLVMFAGRLIKHIFVALVSVRAPQFLGKLWGIKDEMKELQVKPPRAD